MKNSKLRRALMLAACAVMLVCLSVGATLAYLMDDTEVVTNTFAVGEVVIDIWETDTDDDDNTADNGTGDYDGKDKANDYKVYPGRTYTKDPTIYIQKGSEDCYVAAKIVVTADDFAELKNLLGYSETDGVDLLGFGGIVTGGVFDDAGLAYQGNGIWESDALKLIQVLGSNESTFYVVWKDVQAMNESADTPLILFENIVIPGTWNNDDIAKMDGLNIQITGYAVQAEGFRVADGKDAEDALVAAFPATFETVLN